MGGRYWFFTEADRLAAQTPAEAFGPVAASPTTQFRVTDLHTAVAASSDNDLPRAYAICDGLLRACLDNEGGLTLVLKPAEQPPFDFPPVSFFLYKGVRPDSLLSGAAPWPLIKTASAADIPMIQRIQQDWTANLNPGDPTRQCLGLHLHPSTPASVGFDPTLYADGQPLDNLFYQGDGRFPPIFVRAGERIGFFAAARFGLEVVVPRIGRPPLIGLARTRETIITAPAMPPDPVQPGDAVAFRSREAREAILDFIDPCAFWGSFRLNELWSYGAPGLNPSPNPRQRVFGSDIYADLLTGPTTSSLNFHNRNLAYIDIRNDHGHSMNYYRETGDELLFAMDPDDPMTPANYYVNGGWPCFPAPLALTPDLPTTASQSPLRLALPAAVGSTAFTYVSVGYSAAGEALKPLARPDRFKKGPLQQNGFSPTMSVAIPVTQLDGTTTTHAGYHRLHQFRRAAMAQPQASPPANNPAPFYRSMTDHLFPIPGADAFPRTVGATGVRTYGDLFYIPPGDGLKGCVARPGVARDQHNTYLFLLPVDVLGDAPASTIKPAFPVFEETTEDQFRPDLRLQSGNRLLSRKIQSTNINLLYEHAAPMTNPALSENFWAIAMSGADYDAAAMVQSSGVAGSATLSMGAATSGADMFDERPSTISYVPVPTSLATVVDRTHAVNFHTLYRHAPV